MSWYPKAVHRPIPEAKTQPGIIPRCIIVHSQGGMGSLYGYWLNGTNLESHFWVSKTGKVEQYVGTETRADANLEANRWREGLKYYGAISIETESTVSASEPWTPAQARAIEDLLAWLCDEHRIERKLMTSPRDNGIGYHVMFGAPGPWTTVRGKVCPGKARTAQLVDDIIPSLAGDKPATQPEDGFLVALSDEAQAKLVLQVDQLAQQSNANTFLLKLLYDIVIGADTAVRPNVLSRLIASCARQEQAIEVVRSNQVRGARDLVATIQGRS